ncbi:MAG: D-3-phosphoglycerate dehydrogenase [Litorivivens sp.]|jgi:D-3-phosphoglycerate dehydrogenase
MKVLFIDTVHEILEQKLSAAGMECVSGYEWNRAQILAEVSSFDGIVIRSRTKIDDTFFEAASNLKWIARSGSGLENIDLPTAGKHHVTVFNSPEGNAQAVGEHATGMLLSLLNNLNRGDNEVRKGIWRREENRGRELNSMSVGIIGYGHTGSAFAKCLSGFGCKILAYDKYLADFGNDLVLESTLEDILSTCDAISLHLPLTDETRAFVNGSFISMAIATPILINTSRGKVVDTEAIVDGLKNGQLAGVCLDVHEYETASFESLNLASLPAPMQYLIASDRVILSPHVAGWTSESYTKLSDYLAKKILTQFG